MKFCPKIDEDHLGKKQYFGDIFKFCPYCGNPLKVELILQLKNKPLLKKKEE